ncbi:hypothetical protein GIB67_002477 [Kingdonia uniflora]|uniref:Vesicle transport v-SNARE N-terminal domain-containing protein n=1 Tax=Kingdonia uniflora TaxID=39325 RepID=A0A7J7LAS5_9MAGN|nr:hypothetical protein GIB67_002477 [Kingdonia uniflora]
MSEVFERYERQYCELLANLSRKSTSANHLDGEQKKQKNVEVKAGLEDAKTLVRLYQSSFQIAYICIMFAANQTESSQ